MAFETLVVAFASAKEATSAIRAVRACGVPANDIRRHPAELGDTEAAKAAVEQDSGIWKWIFGRHISPAESAVYEKAVQSGGTIVSVRIMEEELDRIRGILEEFCPLSLEKR